MTTKVINYIQVKQLDCAVCGQSYYGQPMNYIRQVTYLNSNKKYITRYVCELCVKEFLKNKDESIFNRE